MSTARTHSEFNRPAPASGRGTRRFSIAVFVFFATLFPGAAVAGGDDHQAPQTRAVVGLYTVAAESGELGPPAAFAIAGVDQFSVKFLNIGPWWEVMPRVQVPIDEKLVPIFGVGIQQSAATLYPRVEVGARGQLGELGYYSGTLEVDATHTPLPGGVGWGGLFRAGAKFPVGRTSLEAYFRYEGGGVGGGPALAVGHPVGRARVRAFVGSSLLKGDSTTRSLADFTAHPLSGVMGGAMQF